MIQLAADIPRTEKAWGAEHLICNAGGYCGKLLSLNKGWQCSLHHHVIKDEVLYVRSGRVRFQLEYETFVMLPGDSIRVLSGQKHRFAGLEDSEIIEFSTHDEPSDSYRLTQSGPMTE